MSTMLGSTFIDAINNLCDMVDYYCGNEYAVIVMHCWEWDRLVRMAMADGIIGPSEELDRYEIIENAEIRLEEGVHYEDTLLITKARNIQ